MAPPNAINLTELRRAFAMSSADAGERAARLAEINVQLDALSPTRAATRSKVAHTPATTGATPTAERFELVGATRIAVDDAHLAEQGRVNLPTGHVDLPHAENLSLGKGNLAARELALAEQEILQTRTRLQEMGRVAASQFSNGTMPDTEYKQIATFLAEEEKILVGKANALTGARAGLHPTLRGTGAGTTGNTPVTTDAAATELAEFKKNKPNLSGIAGTGEAAERTVGGQTIRVGLEAAKEAEAMGFITKEAHDNKNFIGKLWNANKTNLNVKSVENGIIQKTSKLEKAFHLAKNGVGVVLLADALYTGAQAAGAIENVNENGEKVPASWVRPLVDVGIAAGMTYWAAREGNTKALTTGLQGIMK